jgi:tetratricopeptide (TPR) repeat protein
MMKLINWVLGVALWFAGIAENILFFFLRHWAYFFGVAAAALVLISHWVALTISNRLSGLHAPLFGYVTGKSASPILSWGVVAAVLILAVSVTYAWKRWRSMAVAGTALLLLAFAGLLQVAFGEADLLKEIGDEEQNFAAIQDFENVYLPMNSGHEPSNAQGPALSAAIVTAWDRVVTARYFMGRGWYVVLLVGVAAFFAAKKRLDKRHRSLLMRVMLLGAVGLAVGFSLRPVIAQMTVARGQDAEAKGELDLSIARYRRAMRLDKWFAIRTDLYQRIGAIDYNFGRTDTIEYGIFFAELMASQRNLIGAIHQYEKLDAKAEQISPTMAELVRTRQGDLWTAYGKGLYAQGAIGVAVPAWENALAKDQSQWLAAFGLCRAYFEIGHYQQSIDLVQRIIKGVRDPETRADLEMDLGDAYMRLNEVALAHLAYRRSYLIDYVMNWRGLSDLIGAQNQISLQDNVKGN